MSIDVIKKNTRAKIKWLFLRKTNFHDMLNALDWGTQARMHIAFAHPFLHAFSPHCFDVHFVTHLHVIKITCSQHLGFVICSFPSLYIAIHSGT